MTQVPCSSSEQDRQEPAPLFRAAQVATSPPHGEAQSLESSSSVEISGSSEPPTVLVAGALAVDVSCDFSPSSSSSAALLPQQHTSNPAIISQSIGGVGHNVAKALHYLGAPVLFCSKIGDDVAGHAAIAALHEQSFPTAGVKISGKDTGQRTAQYVAVNDAKKDLVLAMADMSIFETPTAKEDFRRQWGHILDGVEPSTVVIDANWDHTTITRWLEYAEQLGGTTVLEPVSVAKCARLFSTRPGEESWFGTKEHAKRMALASPNALELASMHRAARDSGLMDEPRWWRYINELNIPSTGARDKFVQIMPRDFVDQGLPQMAIQMLPFISTIVTKLGANGVLLTQVLKRDDVRLREGDSAKYMLSRGEGEIGGVYMRYFPAVELVQDDEILSVNGVGDTFLGAIVAGMAKKGKQETRIEDLIDIGQKAAILTLKSTESASPELRALRGLIS